MPLAGFEPAIPAIDRPSLVASHPFTAQVSPCEECDEESDTEKRSVRVLRFAPSVSFLQCSILILHLRVAQVGLG